MSNTGGVQQRAERQGVGEPGTGQTAEELPVAPVPFPSDVAGQSFQSWLCLCRHRNQEFLMKAEISNSITWSQQLELHTCDRNSLI